MEYKSDILETIHENATANFEIGAISEERMREYDEMCLIEDSKTTQKTDSSEKIEHIDLVAV
jgi:DNA-binding transcriptional regulator YiaG